MQEALGDLEALKRRAQDMVSRINHTSKLMSLILLDSDPHG